ncbi:hypothetical protein [Streptomyces sp. HPF1205]|uniref:hypothetical protein n=1 Tax=Streptomyces sp. HPF1205 TaxID=2873262 RepID=UPI001CED1601|nr:hypothetical protein [Streptomyces sp. HPF1205]
MAQYEYAKIYYHQEGSFSRPGTLIWTAQILWPGAERLDIRDEVSIESVLAELGRDGWELVSEMPSSGINAREFRLKRQVK